jgi:transposase InsO family protein
VDKGGLVYLAVVLDAYSRKIVGFSMNERMTQQLVIDALEMAVSRRNPQRGPSLTLTAAASMPARLTSSDYGVTACCAV